MSNFPIWFQPHFFDKNLPKDREYNVLQIGTYTGDATEWLLDNRNIITIDDVDTWEGSLELAHETINFAEVEVYYDSRFGEDSRVIKHKMTSNEFFKNNTKKYDFILIDGDHTASQTAIDGLNAFQCLEVGGIMAFDDYEWNLGKGSYYNPKDGINAVLNIAHDYIRVIELTYQAWIEKVYEDQ